MSPTLDAALRSWAFEPVPLLLLGLTTLIYWRGWRQLHRQTPHRFPGWRLVSFSLPLSSCSGWEYDTFPIRKWESLRKCARGWDEC